MISVPRQSNFGPNSRGGFNGTGCGRNWRLARVTSPRPVNYMPATRGAQVIPNYKMKHDTAYVGVRVRGRVCGNYATAELDFDSARTRLLFVSSVIRCLGWPTRRLFEDDVASFWSSCPQLAQSSNGIFNSTDYSERPTNWRSSYRFITRSTIDEKWNWRCYRVRGCTLRRFSVAFIVWSRCKFL